MSMLQEESKPSRDHWNRDDNPLKKKKEAKHLKPVIALLHGGGDGAFIFYPELLFSALLLLFLLYVNQQLLLQSFHSDNQN